MSDQAIRALIDELTVGSRRPSGVRLRAVLAERFGCRGGVKRIYRLLGQERDRAIPPAGLEERAAREFSAKERSELEALRERAVRAEEREEAHQLRWAKEVDELRTRLTVLEPLALQTQSVVRERDLLRAQLRAAQSRITQLEDQLLETPECSRSPSKP